MDETFPLCEPWATADEAKERCGDDAFGTHTDDEITRALEVASVALFGLSGFKYRGHCERIEQPPGRCHCSCLCIEAGCGCCSCDNVDRLMLSGYPVREIVAVTIDGDVLGTDEYRLLSGRWLIRMADTNGNAQRWPTRNRLDLPIGDVGTWSVDYIFGTRPPQWGIDAAIDFAKVVIDSCDGGGDCALPSNVTNYVRQGVAVTLDPNVLSGLVGAEIADAWLRNERAAARMLPPRFYNPDDFCQPEIVSTVGVDAS